MTAADHANTVRGHLPSDYLGPDPNDMDGEKWGQHPEALAALDALQAQAEDRDKWKGLCDGAAMEANENLARAEAAEATVEQRVVAIRSLLHQKDVLQSRAEAAEAERDRLSALAALVSGVLCDAETIPVAETTDVKGLHQGLRALLAERDAACLAVMCSVDVKHGQTDPALLADLAIIEGRG